MKPDTSGGGQETLQSGGSWSAEEASDFLNWNDPKDQPVEQEEEEGTT